MDGLNHYAPSSGYPAAPNAYSNGQMQPPQQAFYPMMSYDNRATYSSTRRTIVMGKQPGERSFGMTLEQTRDIRANDFPRVSHVFDNSAAYRAGIRRGWIVESINGVHCQGRSVREVASVFRELHQVTLQVDIAEEGVPQPAPAPVPHTVPSFPFPSTASLPHQAMLPNSFAALLRPPPLQPANTPAYSQPPMHHHSAVPAYRAPPPRVTQVSSTAHSTSVPLVPTPAAPVFTTQTPAAPNVPVWHVSQLQPATQATGSFQHQRKSEQPKPPETTDALPRPDAAVVPPAQTSSEAKAPPTPPADAPTEPSNDDSKATPAVSTSNTPSEQASQPVENAAESKPTQPAVPSPSKSHASPSRPAAPSTPSTSTTPAQPPRSTGKKRARGQQIPAESEGTANAATGRKRGGRQKKKAQAAPATEIWDSDDASYFYGSDASVEEVYPPSTSTNGSGNRRYSTRQAESGGRQRRSLTVSRLMTMGFTQQDAEASVEVNGHDPDKCMLWIVSHFEERQFLNDLNKASIESEQQKLLEAQEQKKQETETLRQATAFTSLFPTSYILSGEAEAPQVKHMLSSTIGNIAADTLMRTLMTKLLTVESKAIRWYKAASRCYMLQLAARLETAFASHDPVTCCSKVMASEDVDRGCSFVKALHEEERALTKALFDMPENQGGVPVEFLRADESMQFSLDDDGFEVVEMPSAQSPGPE